MSSHRTSGTAGPAVKTTGISREQFMLAKPAARRKRAPGPEPTENESALSASSSRELSDLTDEQVTEEAKAGLDECGAGTRSMVIGARRAGAAFAAMRARKPGGYTVWLMTHFNKTPQTARLYVRIHENWALIEANGWEVESLRTLTRLLGASSAGREHEPDLNDVNQPHAGTRPQIPTVDQTLHKAGAPGTDAPASQNRQVILPFRADELVEFEEALDWLCNRLKLDSRSDAALQAARRWRREEERHV
jgi:hypothetical protein